MSSGIAASGTVTATRWSAMLRHHRWWLTRIGVLPVHYLARAARDRVRVS